MVIVCYITIYAYNSNGNLPSIQENGSHTCIVKYTCPLKKIGVEIISLNLVQLIIQRQYMRQNVIYLIANYFKEISSFRHACTQENIMLYHIRYHEQGRYLQLNIQAKSGQFQYNHQCRYAHACMYTLLTQLKLYYSFIHLSE